MTKRNRLQALMNEHASAHKAAPVVERHETYRDEYSRHYAKISVELTQGVWSTFSRPFGSGDAYHRYHASREAANAYAQEWIAR